jgi:hypothetical protein
MKEIILIGTLHSSWTPHNELEDELQKLKPDQVLVELSPEELNDRPREQSIRDEMFAAYDWATKSNVPVKTFDLENDILKTGVTGKEPEFFEYEVKSKELLKNYSWKQLNNDEPWKSFGVIDLEQKMDEKLFDSEKSKKRDVDMLENIKADLVEGINIVVTGVGHLTFFQQNLPDAKVPLRDLSP